MNVLEMIILNSMKKVKSFIFSLLLMFFLTESFGFCDVNVEEKPPEINALAAVVMETSSGRVLYSKNAAAKRSIASTTKIMTAIVALENGNLEDEVTVSKKAAAIGGSTIGLQTGQKFTLRELLYAMLLISANDAAIAVAEHVGGTVEGFAEMMNQEAKSLGAADSHFVTPHGLDREDQYSTAYDLAIITKHALKNSVFAEIVSTKSSSIPGYSLYNTNDLLGSYQGVDGVKTGYTGKAGRCLVTTIQKDNMRLITVVLGAPTRTARANASKALLDYAFASFKMRKLLNAGDIFAKVPVYRGIENDTCLRVSQTVELPLSDAEMERLEVRQYVPDIVNAPVYAGTDSGYVEYLLNNEVIAQSMLTIPGNIRKKTYLDYLKVVVESWGRLMREGCL